MRSVQPSVKTLPALSVLSALVGCGASPPPPQTFSSLIALPESLTAEAAYVRGLGGNVALVETVSLVETVPGPLVPTGIDGVNTQTPEGHFMVRVLDSLGGSWSPGDEVSIQTVVGDPEVVDDSGAPRSDWLVSDSNQLLLRGAPSEGSYVAFVGPGDPAGVYFVAVAEGGVVSGANTRSGESLALDALSR